jgi:hypothetical protein
MWNTVSQKDLYLETDEIFIRVLERRTIFEYLTESHPYILFFYNFFNDNI